MATLEIEIYRQTNQAEPCSVFTVIHAVALVSVNGFGHTFKLIL